MKRNRLKTHGTYSKTQKKAAVIKVNRLIKEGLTMNAATIAVAAEVGAHKGSVAYWIKTMNKPTTTTVKTVTKNSNLTTTDTSAAKRIQGLENMKNQLGVVFTSLITKDGVFDNKDATAISSISSQILGSCKQVLLEKKYADREVRWKNATKRSLK